MTPKDPFLEGTFWDKFWRPIRSRALFFTPERCKCAKEKKLRNWNQHIKDATYPSAIGCNTFDSVNTDVLYFSCPEAPHLRQTIKVLGLDLSIAWRQEI